MVAGKLVLVAFLTACGGGSEGVAEPGDPSNGSLGMAPPNESADPDPETQATTTAPAPPPAVTSPAPTPPPESMALDANTTCSIPGFQADLLQQVNTARSSARQCGSNVLPGVAPLSWDARLFSAAARHSTDMAQNNYFSHTSLDGRTLGQRIQDEGYVWTAVGENIAAGQSSVSAVMSGWLSSPGHCANIMRANYAHVAVACVRQSGSDYGRYWTMVLARP